MIDRLLYLGATHKTAALAVRERLACGAERLPRLLSSLGRVAEERLVLSTCGRFEVYVIQEAERQAQWPRWFGELTHQREAWLRGHLEVLRGAEAARRALRVASGLESQLVGEDQILGQLRQAFCLAQHERAVGPMLSALFRAAIHAGKRARSETAIGRSASSFARLAAECVAGRFPHRRSVAILILGTGALAAGVADRLHRQEGISLAFAGRHPDRVTNIASRFGGGGIDLAELSAAVACANAVIGCAAPSRYLITPRELRDVCGRLLMIDLGMPRNVDPAVASDPRVELIGLDEFTSAGTTRTSSDAVTAISEAERIVGEELNRFLRWVYGRRAAPIVAELTRWADRLEPDQRRRVRRALHGPLMRLKEHAA